MRLVWLALAVASTLACYFLVKSLIFTETACGWAIKGEKPLIETIRSPKPFQIFQENQRKGFVRLSADAAAELSCAEVRVVTRKDTREVLSWTRADINSRHIEQTVEVPEGGNLRLEIRALSAGRLSAIASVEPIGVGEVFVTAGQSNATFFGEQAQASQSDLVSYFDGVEWTRCKDPLPRVDPQRQGGSPWCLLGDQLVNRYGVPIAFVPVGFGNTTVSQWSADGRINEGMPPGYLRNRLIERLSQLGPMGARAILWHQGESDVLGKTSGRDYKQDLLSLIGATRKVVGFDIPWFVAEVSYVDGLPKSQRESADAVLAAQRAVVDGDTILTGSQSDKLTGQLRYDGTHLSNEGLRAHAEQWFAVISSYLDRKR